MRINRLSGWTVLVALGWAAAVSALAQDGPLTLPWLADFETTGDELELITADGEAAAVPETCLTFGGFTDLNAGRNRYRGNVYQIEEAGAELQEIRMELRFRGTVNLYFSIHHTKCGSGGAYLRVRSDIVVTGTGATNPNETPKPAFYTTGRLSPPVALERGYCYAIGASWTETSSTTSRDVTYGRDLLTYPRPFLHGQVAGPVALNITPPLADDLGALFVFTDGAYSQELCFTSVAGACCCGDGCLAKLKTACTGVGCHFFGERIGCNEVVCDFGACCFPCGECREDYVAEACEADGGAKHWSGADCLADPDVPDALCPEITGACCFGDVCEELCLDDCLDAGGVHRGDGTSCEPNVCVGACCLNGGCLELTAGFCGWLSGRYRGDGTICATLPSAQECGGACCWQIGTLKGCQNVAYRAACTIAAGISQPRYAGAGTLCSDSLCTGLTDLGACCLPNGTCLFTTADACAAEVPGGGDFTEDDGNGTAMCQTPCPTRACCFRDGTCRALTVSACTATGGTPDLDRATCQGVSCSAILTPGACCGMNRGVCEEIPEFTCIQRDDIYLGDNTTCSNPPESACPGFGACCRDDGDCFDQSTETDCVTFLQGRYQGDGSMCEALAEPCDLRGACCTKKGRCLFVLEDECLAVTGVPEAFQEVGEACPPSGLCATGACCTDGDCKSVVSVFCQASAGQMYLGDGKSCYPSPCTIGACCIDYEPWCIDTVKSDCDTQGGEFHDDLTCADPDPCPPLVGACCKDNECFADRIPVECEILGGVWQGHATVCGPGLCTIGACCLDGGSCIDSVKSRCDDEGGEFHVNLTCVDDGLCPIGACCKNNVCFDKSFLDCEFLGGVWLGPGTDCLPDPCTPGACCFDDGSCIDYRVFECDAAGGEFHVDLTCVNGLCPIGACCYRDGTCENNIEGTDCEDARGEFWPVLTCDEVPTCEPRGACCWGGECLVDKTSLECGSLGGVYLGDVTDCLPDICVLGACCPTSGDCVDYVVAAECTEPHATFEAGMVCVDIQCDPRGACCEGLACGIKTQTQCGLDGGWYAGTGVLCEPSPCPLCQPPRMVGSYPPNCAIDARQPSKPDGTSPAGWNAIDVTFNADARGLTPDDFTVRVEPGPATVPVITAVVATAAPVTVTLELDGRIPTRHWTCFTYDCSGDEVCLGYLPGDVNGDRTAAPADILRVIDCLNNVATCTIYQCDVDRSNVCGPPDILRVIDLLNGAGVYDPWLNVRLPVVCPSTP